MEVFAARFPIFDRAKCVYGYELTHRGGWNDYRQALAADAGRAGKDALGFDQLLGGKRGFLAFDPPAVLAGIPQAFSTDTTVVCLDAKAPAARPLLEACAKLVQGGYPLSLAGFDAACLKSPLLPFASIVNVDFQSVPTDVRKTICRVVGGQGVSVLASQLRSEAEFAQAQQDGCTLFGGVFFQTPNINPHADRLSPSRLIAMQLLRDVNKPDVSPEELANLVQRDVGLTYQLLRLVNSAWFGLRHQILSLRHALVYLGMRETQRWASTMAMCLVNDDKPGALLELALTRAKFAESLASLGSMADRASEFFLLGMFSLLDAITDRPMEEILGEVALAESVKQAILGRSGDCLPIYKALLAYEHGLWVLFGDLAKEIGIDPDRVPPLHRAAVQWAQQAHAFMGSSSPVGAGQA